MVPEPDREWSLEQFTDEDIEQVKERITEAFDAARAWLAEDDRTADYDED